MKLRHVKSHSERLRRIKLAICSLAAQCLLVASTQAQTDAQPVGAQGRIKSGDAVTTALPISICESARLARERNSPAAPGLEAQCNAQPIEINGLAARGETIVSKDPLAVALLQQHSGEHDHFGFLVGMAAAEGHTEPGPGKNRIRGKLAEDEHFGFDEAVSFSLIRNKNAALVDTATAITATDPRLARLRTMDADPLYWLGFDIATGLFGDPAKGAAGNTQTGPGSQKIRDSMSPAGKRGFNAAVDLHLSRDYLTRKPSAEEIAQTAAYANRDVLNQVESLISGFRENNGLEAVTLDPALIQIATDHANRMVQADHLVYALPDEGNLQQRLIAGKFNGTKAVEILHGGSKTAIMPEVFNAWVNNSQQYKKLLTAGVSRIGIYVAYSPPGKEFETYWSMVLGEPSPERSP